MSVKSQISPFMTNDGVSGRRALKMVIGLPLWVVLSFALAQVVIIIMVHIGTALGIAIPNITETVANTLIAASVYILTLGIATGVPYALYRRKTNRQDLGLTRLPSWMDILLTPAAGVVYLLLSGGLLALLTHFFTGINVQQAQDTGFTNIAGQSQYVLAFLTLVVMAPLAEETLFRGYLYGKLRRYVPVWVSILVTSGLFGLAHGQWNVGIDTFALSVVLCSLREITGSIWAGVLLHALKNAVAFYFLFINPLGLGTLGG